MTIRQTVATWLVKCGWYQDTSNADAKHWTYAKPGKADKIFLGRCGSVRIGRTRRMSKPIGLIGQLQWIQDNS